MMRLTIQRKVFLATFLLATMLVLLLAAVMRWNLGQGFERYTSAAEFARLDWLIHNIESEYAAHGNWDFVRADPERVWRQLSRPGDTASRFNGTRRGEAYRGTTNRGEARPGEAGRGLPPPFAGEPERWRPPPPPGGDGAWRPDLPPPPPPPADAQGAPEPPAAVGAASSGQARPGDTLRIGPRLALLDADGKRLAGNASGHKPGSRRAIVFRGTPVGQLSLEAAPSSVDAIDDAFLASQTQNIAIAGLAALGLSMLAAWWLARLLLAPIRDLGDGARRIADGWLDARIPVRADDELGELARNFNAMAGRLAKIEESRRAWISDASHELRTPLAVLRAEIEAMQDGVRSPDAATLARLHKQVQQLSTLVDDLRLTLDRPAGADTMDHLPFAPFVVLDEVLAAFGERFAAAAIEVETRGVRDTRWLVRGDADRLTQVFSNLLENTLRYTDRGGRLRITSGGDGQRLWLQFDDTAPAPPRAALPRLFERFYRAEPSRSRGLGGSGLGLAICKTLVEAHGGCISASLSELGGLAVRIDLPIDRTSEKIT